MTPRLEIVMVPTDDLVMYEGNAKLHPSEQVDQIAESVERYGYNDPIAAWHDENGEPVIVEGHGRLLAAEKLGISQLPVIFLDFLTDEQRRAYELIHNQLTINSGFDYGLLISELESIAGEGLDFAGFDVEREIEKAASDFRDGAGKEIIEKNEKNDGFVVCPRCGHVQRG